MYIDNESKFIAVINAKTEIGPAMNALGHITAGLMAKVSDFDSMDFLKYEFETQKFTPAILSRYPFIILKAKSNNHLKSLHQALNNSGILHNVFTDSMLGSSAKEQQKNTKNTGIEDLTYLAIVMFGKTEQLTTFTRKFSIFKI